MAASVDEKESPAVGSRGLRVSLGGLMVLVLAAGLAAGVVRSARDVWGVRGVPTPTGGAGSPVWGGGEVPVERTAGVVLEVAGVFLLVVLARALIWQFRSPRPVDEHERRMRRWSISWRLGAACFLLWFISQESEVLRIDFARQAELSRLVSGADYNYRVEQQLLPACGLFAILGLVLGMGATFLLPKSTRTRSRPYWLFVILAAVTAVLITTITGSGSLITHLVLIAIEAVTYAMQHHLSSGRGLWTRLLHAGIDAAVAAGFCIGLALAVARDFETLRRGKLWTTSRAGRWLRIVLLAGTAGAGCYLVAVTFPAIHPCFAAGFRLAMRPADAGMIVGCFGAFGAGMAARVIAHEPPQQPSLWIGRLSAFCRLAIPGAILFALLNIVPDPLLLEPYVPRFVSASAGLIKAGVARFWAQFPDSFAAIATEQIVIEKLLWTSLVVASVCFVIEMLLRDDSQPTSPFDRLAESPERPRRFIWLVLGFVVVCLTAIPTLIVASQVLLLLREVGGLMLSNGWAN